jgi:hypothetical protein
LVRYSYELSVRERRELSIPPHVIHTVYVHGLFCNVSAPHISNRLDKQLHTNPTPSEGRWKGKVGPGESTGVQVGGFDWYRFFVPPSTARLIQ